MSDPLTERAAAEYRAERDAAERLRPRIVRDNYGPSSGWPPTRASDIAPPEPMSMPSSDALAFTPTPFKHRDLATFPRREFIYGRLYIRQFLSATVAPGGVGKSALAIAESVAMASGRDLLGVTPVRALRVWYWNGEDPAEEIQRRVEAVCLHFDIDPKEIEGRLFMIRARTRDHHRHADQSGSIDRFACRGRSEEGAD